MSTIICNRAINNDKFNSEVFVKSLSEHFKFHNMSLDIVDGEKNILVNTIENFVHLNKPDILAMLTHKRNVFEKIFSFSKTMEISYQLSVPLLALK